MTTPFLRLLKFEDKESALASSIASIRSGAGDPSTVFPLDPVKFAKVPNSPFAYWVDDDIRDLFTKFPPFESDGRNVRVGLQTGKDFRFVRAWWEVPEKNRLDARDGPDWHDNMPAFQSWCCRRTREAKYWAPFAKGGEYSPYYADIHLVVNWKNEGEEIKCFSDPNTGKPNSRPQNTEFYFRPGFTWSYRTHRLCFQELPATTIISVRGSGAYVSKDSELAALLAYGNTRAADSLIKLTMGREGHPQFDQGDVKTLPVIKKSDQNISESGIAILRQIKAIYSNSELCLSFFSGSVSYDKVNVEPIIECQNVIEGYFKIDLENDADFHIAFPVLFDKQAIPLTQLAFGHVFGRFDIRMAHDPSLAPPKTNPFDPLPVCPPAMLVGTDGLPAKADNIASEAWLRARPNVITFPLEPARSQKITAADYPLDVPWDGILVDDSDEPRDILTRLRAALGYLHGDVAEEKERVLCTELGLTELRNYLRKPSLFFDGHLQCYSKSGRKAPIYWPLQTRDGRYTIWLYYPRLSSDTLYASSNILEDKLKLERRKIEMARDDLAKSENKADRLIVEELANFTAALAEMKEEIDRVAGLPFRPDLDDGVQITASPLWRLFRHPSWQKELKATWEKLEEGDYDWAHLAYSIWPDRVREKCKKDRSLAIAHGLEHICELKAPVVKAPGKKRGRKANPFAESDLDFEEDE